MDPENEYQEEYENDEEIQEENGEEEDGNGQEEFISGYERVKGKKRHRSSQEDFQENDHGQQEYFRGKSGEENHEYRYKIRRSGSDRSDIEQSYDHKSRRRSGTDFSDHEEERERRRRKKSEDREGKSRRRHHKHKKDRSKRSKSRLDDSRSSQELEPEDGEILEDGEIDEEEDDGEGDKDGTELEGEITHPDDLNMHPNQGARKKFDREVSEKSDGSYWNEEEYEEGYDEGRRSEGEEEINQQYKPDKRRHRRDKRERRGRRDDKRKKSKKGSKYHDYDNIDDDAQQGWMGPKKHSPGSRRTPPTDFNSPIYRGDKDDFGVMYNRGPPGPYDSPYESPPGPYDSPSDEDSQDEFGGKRDRNKKSKTMMNMLEDEMLDPNIAVDEGQMLYKRQGRKKKPGDRGGRDGHERGHKRKQQNKDYGDQYSEQPKKKPLLQTPMEERPICRFFKEGKCQKGNDCPFNHEGRLDKKPELCKYYLNSYCSKEDNCIFMHSEFPCKFFHTGQECYQGDDCKFSHDPLTEETRHLIEKKYNDHEEDRRHGNKPVRPSLLGSPPRHLMMDPATQERIKKIPSLFDIETFPPGHSPKKPMSQQQHGGMQNNHPPPHMQQQQQQRPTGFFNEINPSRMQGPGPGMHHPRGPMNQRPPRPPMEPPMGQRPMNPGPMGPRMNQGPMGPMNPPPRPMNQLNPALNPAVALVGALLQHAAGARPPLGGQPGGPGPNQGMMGQFHGGPDQQGNFGPDGPMENHRDPRQMQHNPDESQYPNGSHYDEQGHDTEDYEHWDENQNDPDMYGSRDELNDRSDVGKNDDPNKEKLAMIGLGTEMYSHLPSKHREMFLRMQGQQSIPEDMDLQKNGKINPEREKDIKKDRGEDKENKDKDVDDDNWYSSDEEENGGPKPKLTDILKNLSQQSSASTPQSPKSAGVQGTSTSSTLNIMQMINAIKTGGSTGAQAPSPSSPQILRDPRQRLDPRTGAPMKSNDPRTPPIIPVDSKLESVERNLPPPPPAIINSCEGDVQFRLVPVTKDSSSRTPPPGVNLHDPQYKNDPRIQKMLKHAETTNTNKSVPSDQKPADPRTQSERPSDPRVKVGSDGGKPADPRLQRGVSDSVGPRPQDPRLLRNQPNPPPIGVHNLPVKPTDPRLLNRQISQSSGSVGSTDPRLARQLSSSGNAPSRPADPRLMRQNSNQFHDMRQGPNKPKLSNIEQEPQRLDPRIKVGGPHRVMGDEQISVNNLNQQNDVQIPPLSVPTDSRQLGRQNSLDPRSKLKTEPFGSNLTDTRVPQISIEDGSENVQLTRQISNLDSEMEKTSAQSDQTDKPKLDYRNDPRFKRKPASKRKGSMEYASPLGDEGNQENVTGFNSYNRPQSNSTRPAKSSDSKNNKFDPRTNKHETNVSKSGNLVNIIEQIKEEPGSLTPPIPELPTFNPPPEPEINTKDFFKTMDPTASPFC